MMKKVCIICPVDIRFSYPTLKGIAYLLSINGFRVDMIIPQSFVNGDLYENHFNITTIRKDWLIWLKDWIYRFPYSIRDKINTMELLFKFAAKLFRKKEYDIYIGVQEVGSIVAGLMSKVFRRNKLFIAYLPEIQPIKSLTENIFRRFVSMADAVMDVDENRLSIREKLYSLPERKFVIYNCPLISEIKQVELARSKNKSNRKNVLWYHGCISPDHGIDILLDSYKRMERKVELHLTGPFLSEIYRDEFIKKIKIFKDKVFLHKPLKRKDLLCRARDMADVAVAFYPWKPHTIDINPVYLEMNHKFANPAKIFDYMALGIPVITSDNPTLIEHVERNGWGRCVALENLESIKITVEELIENVSLREEMSNNARKLFLTKYNLDNIAAPFINWLKST